LLTHIHLDHAGTTGALVQENPDLKVYVHEFGAVHLVDPSRLLASAGRLYGGDLKVLYGECAPVPDGNLRPLRGGEKIRVGEVELRRFIRRGTRRTMLPTGIASPELHLWGQRRNSSTGRRISPARHAAAGH
jgi:glyoxylase-like metal-dependent hydrolase (beta-lactamase superfamily II)